MGLEGRIAVHAQVAQGVVTSVDIRSSRRVDACRVLVGLTVEEAVARVPLLFSVCARAQAVAALKACEAALGLDVEPAREAARQLWVLGEALDNHAWQVALQWPTHWGGQPAVTSLRALRDATRQLGESSGLPLPMALGSTVDAPSPDLGARLDAVDSALAALCGPPLPGSPSSLEAWMSASGAGPQAVKHLVDAGLASWGRCTHALLPPLHGTWFLDATQQPDFERAPRFQGQPAETGALARHAHTPILQHLLAQHGNGLLTRWVARLADMQFLAQQARVTAKNLRSAAAVQTSHRRETRGASVVETSRGALAHVVGVDGDRVTSWRVVAPTEWNFHPDGPMARGLVGAPAQDLHKRISLLAAGLDPCVAFEVFIHGDGNA